MQPRLRTAVDVALFFVLLVVMSLCPVCTMAQIAAPSPALDSRKRSPVIPLQQDHTHEITSCPTGAILVPNVVLGNVCRDMKSGINTVLPNAEGACPSGYRLLIQTGTPICSSNVAGNPQGPTAAARVIESWTCPQGLIPIIDYHGEMECRHNPQKMGADKTFILATDCPISTYPGVKDAQTGCIKR
ncbi:MAG: hypothetical protein P4M13_05660 [Alphaproteobacteria bacterium]|nr:hypothetical protein [Alphaproteobacteria bacterium]